MIDSTGAGDGGDRSLELLPHPRKAKLQTKSQIKKLIYTFFLKF